MLCVLFLTQRQVLVPLLLCLVERLPQVLHLLLEILGCDSELEFGLGKILGEGADRSLTLLDLAHVSLSKGLDFILMGLVQLVNLTLCFLLSDH